MALLGNGVRRGASPVLALGNTSSVERGGWNQPGSQRSFFAGEATTNTVAGKTALPGAERHPNCWLMAQKPGGLNSYEFLEGVGTLTGALALGRGIAATLAGTSDLTAAGYLTAAFAGTLTGTGTLTAAGDVPAVLAATAAGAGALAASIDSAIAAAAALTGVGTLAGDLGSAIAASASLTSEGTLAGAADAAGSAAATLAGTSTLAGDGETAIVANATLAGVGTLTAPATAEGHAVAALAGVGTLAAGPEADGSIAAVISTDVANTLTADQCAAAVWSAVSASYNTAGTMGELQALLTVPDGVEPGFTVRDVLRLLSAVTAGKVSGGPGAPVFRNLPDTADRVSGTADSSGNRTAVTYNP